MSPTERTRDARDRVFILALYAAGVCELLAGFGAAPHLLILVTFAAFIIAAWRSWAMKDIGAALVLSALVILFNPIIPATTLLAAFIIKVFAFSFHEPFDAAIGHVYRILSAVFGVAIVFWAWRSGHPEKPAFLVSSSR